MDFKCEVLLHALIYFAAASFFLLITFRALREINCSTQEAAAGREHVTKRHRPPPARPLQTPLQPRVCGSPAPSSEPGFPAGSLWAACAPPRPLPLRSHRCFLACLLGGRRCRTSPTPGPRTEGTRWEPRPLESPGRAGAPRTSLT